MKARTLAAVATALASLPACHHVFAPPALFPVATVWVAPVEDVIEGSLASDGLRIFVSTREGSLTAFDPTGAQTWRLQGLRGGIAAARGVLAVRQADGTLSSLDPETGAIRWTTATGITGPLAPVIDIDRLLVGGEGLAAVDLATGRALWSLPGPPTVSAAPLGRGPWLLLAESDGTLRCRDRANGTSLWTYRTQGALLASPAVDDRRRVLFGTTDRRFQSVGLAKGRPGWRWKLGADVQSPPVVYADKVLFASYEAVLYALNRGNGHLVWRAPLPSRPVGGPVLVGDAVLVACYENDVLGFSARTGRRLGGLKTPAEIRTPPLVVEDRLYLGLRDRSVVAYRLDMTPKVEAPETPRPQPTPRRRR